MKPFYISELQRFNYRHSRVIHGLRIALAFIITFIVANLCGLPDKTWIFITVIVLIDPVVFLGNVWVRSSQRIVGTLFGAVASLIGLYLHTISISVMYLWCAVVMFISGYYTLSRRAYAALVIGTTLAVVIGAPHGDINTALYRIIDVIIGTLLSLLFSAVLPQRAFTHWCLDLLQIFTKLQQLLTCNVALSVTQRAQQLQQIYQLQQLVVPAALEQRLPVVRLNEINLLCHALSSDVIRMKQIQQEEAIPTLQPYLRALLQQSMQPLIEQLTVAIGRPSDISCALQQQTTEHGLTTRCLNETYCTAQQALLKRYQDLSAQLQQTQLQLSTQLAELFKQE